MPKMARHCAGAINNKIYVFGGYFDFPAKNKL